MSDNGENCFTAFALALFRRVSEWVQTTGIPLRAIQEVKFTDKGFGPQSVAIPDYWAVFRPGLEAVWSMPEAEACDRSLLSSGILKVPSMWDEAGNAIPNPSFDQYKATLINEIITQIVLALRRFNVFPLTAEQIRETYALLKEARTSSVKRRRLTVPLINFQSQVTPINLGPVELTDFTPEEKTTAWNAGPFDMTVTVYDFSRVKFKLSGTYVQAEPATTGENSAITDAESVITALRLLKPGDVGALWTWDRPEDSRDSSVIGGADMTPFHARRFGSVYHLCSEDIPELGLLYEQLKSLQSQGLLKTLDVGVRRFNQAYGRNIQEDRVIDLTVALESLLLAGVNDELQYRLALRGAVLLRKSWQPANSFALLKAIYEARSSIVHEGKTLDDLFLQGKILAKLKPHLEPSKFLEEAEQIVRAVIREYLHLLRPGTTLEKINEDLDRYVVDSLGV